MTVVRELARYKLNLVFVQEVRWDKGDTEQGIILFFLYGKGNENQVGTRLFVHLRIVTAFKNAEFVSYRMLYRDLEYPGVHGKMILEWIFERWDMGAWTGPIWPRIKAEGGLLLTLW
jgi:hypothetical protein